MSRIGRPTWIGITGDEVPIPPVIRPPELPWEGVVVPDRVTVSATGELRCSCEAKFERLLFLLSLTVDERAFCRAIAAGEDIWHIYADWLEECGRSEHAKIAREKAAKQEG